MNNSTLNFIKKTENGIFIFVKLNPNSSKNEIIGYCDEYIKIRVSAPPNENKANKKLIQFISDYFNTPKSSVEIVSGDKSRIKKIYIKNISEDVVKQKIFIHDKIII